MPITVLDTHTKQTGHLQNNLVPITVLDTRTKQIGSWYDMSAFPIHQMLCDNLDMQEALISDVKDKGKDAVQTFPEPDNEAASRRLAELDAKFLSVKEQLKRRKVEMLKSSIDWQEFERGLRSCLEWVQSAEQRVKTEIDVSDEELDIGNLKVN